ncbi:MFS transporter [Corynebacterium xerosis]|uniref:MFS transporter n=1 Tax=Corynebacterium xerosis TaxID=1725 RepID=UPI000EACD176|nr:MFS transporter [Corynebacterium xerosis]AYJ33933.1 MFS transporter [Corynebacterium xerosis]
MNHLSSGRVPQATRTRLIVVLVLGQMLGGLGVGSAVSVGALMMAEVSGSPELSGMAATLSTLGAAIASVPLARLAIAKGRGVSLATGSALAAVGAATATIAAAIGETALLMPGMLVLGVGSAVGFQARFAAADAALPHRRGLMLSAVMWSTTVGAVTGPLLLAPSGGPARALGLPELTGPFLITIIAQLLATALYAVMLRPDPLEIARLTDAGEPRKAEGEMAREAATAPATESATEPATGTAEEHAPVGLRPPEGKALVIAGQATVAVAHFVMVTLMSMAPLHMTGHDATLSLVGVIMSLHIAGMWALSPVFGWASDRFGSAATILVGQGLFVLAAVLIWVSRGDMLFIALSLLALGVGWSASVVGGSATVTKATPQPARAAVQGRTDLGMNLAGVVGGLTGGPVLVAIGYSGLAAVAMVPVAVIVVTQLTVTARRAGTARPRG